MQKLNRYYSLIFLLFLSFCSFAELKIVITEGQSNAKPIGVVPFLWSENGIPPQNISEIIASDLKNSGVYAPISANKMPQHPYFAEDVQPDEWLTLGVDSLVVGKLSKVDEDQYQISYQLIDLSEGTNTVISEQSFEMSSRDLRYGAHKISDQIFEKLTGIRGAFSTQIAYISILDRAKARVYELRVSDYDGYNEHVLHRSSEPLMSPAWSADGQNIVYVTFDANHAVLVNKNLITGTLSTLFDGKGHNGAPAFSPDGEKLVFTSSQSGSLNLYLMDLATNAIKQLTFGRSNNTEAAWFPDSNQIIYTSDQTGSPQLYTLKLDDTNPVRFTWANQQNQNATVSPDGNFVMMISTNQGIQHLTRYDIERQFYQTIATTFLDETPSLSPNGAMVIYSSVKGYDNVLNLTSSDGNFKAQLPANEGGAKFPAWSPFR